MKFKTKLKMICSLFVLVALSNGAFADQNWDQDIDADLWTASCTCNNGGAGSAIDLTAAGALQGARDACNNMGGVKSCGRVKPY